MKADKIVWAVRINDNQNYRRQLMAYFIDGIQLTDMGKKLHAKLIAYLIPFEVNADERLPDA